MRVCCLKTGVVFTVLCWSAVFVLCFGRVVLTESATSPAKAGVRQYQRARQSGDARRERAQTRRGGRGAGGQMRCAGAWLLACACALLGAAQARQNSSHLGPGVCQTMDIRNRPESFEKLRNCTVIEGRLSIVLMERYNYSHYQNISFPELREITGHLIMYRIRGLRSLGQLFPNLSVIRGHQLFKDFALVLFENEDLQTLGLHSLTNIERGAVRIERNYKLCYVDTINWAQIAPLSNNNNVIRYNNYAPQCGLCPGEGDASATAKQCPKNSYGQHLCWDNNYCQKVCSAACGSRACMDDGVTCCDPNCLGGCSGTRAEDCHVCRNFSIDDGTRRRCVGICPPQTYKHYNRRCISEQECRSMARPRGEEDYKQPTAGALATRVYKAFNDTCLWNCPLGYVEKTENGVPTCKRCEGVCTRRCSYDKIDSLESAQKFKGCTHIQGQLEISIRGGGNVMEELELCLGMVQEIEGQLKISRSFALVTLSFFKSLRRIHGKAVASPNGPRQSLYIFDNPNLEELWDWKTHGDITIDEGKLFIHFNPKLCFDQIKPLQRMAKDSAFDDLEVSRQSNGDKAACSREELKIWVRTITETAVVLQWKQYCLSDQRQLLGYSIYYTKAPHNVTLYEKRNACQDIWSVEDFSMEAMTNITAPTKIISDRARCESLQPLFHLLPRLEPYTRYAAYIKTYTTQADNKGAQSPIIYFSTLPGKPKPPMISNIESNGPNEMTIKWQKPLIPNGNITTYHILLTWEEDHQDVGTHTNYCLKPPIFTAQFRPKEDEERRAKKKAEEKAARDAEACTCEDGTKSSSIFTDAREAEQYEAIQFENDLQNMVYVKSMMRPERPKRSVDSIDVSYMHTDEPPREQNITTNNGGYYKVLSVERPANVTELLVKRLRHFAHYTVSVWACRALDPSELVNKTVANCSTKATKTLRTPSLEMADLVTKVHAEVLPGNKSAAGVRVSWQPPLAPNGLVLAYNIKHSRIDNENIVTATTCVTREELEKSGSVYNLRNLAAGNYTITVSAVTLAGNGPMSDKAVVIIPERPAEAPREWIVGVVAGCVVALALLAGGVWYARRGLLPTADNNKLFASVNPEYVSTVYVPDEWEVPRANIELVRELGQGSFGMVYEGIARDVVKDNPEMRCAVKTVNEHATDRERVDFLNEASVMKAFDTWHVVRLLGVVSCGQPTLVIMELMERGDLKSYLRSHRPESESSQPTSNSLTGSLPNQPPSLQQIKQMAIEIADGMSYLAAKKFVHRDLAARNCMVAGDLTVKVGDFGMTRDIYETDYYRKGTKGLLPVRWMSPESLKDGVFSSTSDVWSFGVVLWEMATLAMQPYQGLSNEQVLRYVVEGGVMERPEHCPDGLYELMRSCWSHRPSARPSFMQLVAELATTAAPHFRHKSFFHSPTGQEIYAQQQNQEEEEQVEVQVGAVAADSGSNLFGVSGRLASWVRELSSLRSRSLGDDDAAAEPLAPRSVKASAFSGPNGVLPSARYSRDVAPASEC